MVGFKLNVTAGLGGTERGFQQEVQRWPCVDAFIKRRYSMPGRLINLWTIARKGVVGARTFCGICRLRTWADAVAPFTSLNSISSCICKRLPLVLFVFFVGSAWADGQGEVDERRFLLRGFGTLGVTHSSSSQAAFIRDLSQPSGPIGGWSGSVDSLIGLQANYRISENFDGAAQIVSRYRYDGTYRPEVGWAFFKYDPDPAFSVRLGRVGTEFYMLADSRLVGYSYLPVRPPTDYFSPLPIYYMDGGDMTLTAPLEFGLAKVKVFGGVGREKIPVSGYTWNFSGAPIFGSYIDFFKGEWQWRLSYAQIKFKDDLPVDKVRSALRATGVPSAISAADSLTVVNRRAQYYSVGVTYDKGPLQAQLMLSHITHESDVLQNTNSAYALFGRRFGSLTPYVGLSFARSDSKKLTTGLPNAVPPFAALNDGVAAILQQPHVDQRTFFAGVRWDIKPNVATKVQWDRLRGSPESVAYQQHETHSWRGDTNVFSVTLDFVF